MPAPARKPRPAPRPGPEAAPAPAAAATAAPVAPRPLADAAGDSASPQAVARLRAAVSTLRGDAVVPLLRRALACVSADRDREGAQLALQALELDEANGLGWYVLAVCLEKTDDFANALHAYERALQLIPDYDEIANDLGRLAYRLGMLEQAEKLFAWYFVRNPASADAANNFGCALRDQGRFEEAIEVVRPAIVADPGNAMLWNTLGTILYEQGEIAQALTFLDEAVAVDPAFAKARYNRANARLATGDPLAALADVEIAIPQVRLASDLSMMRLARATMRVASGELGAGWDGYEERLNASYADATLFAVDDRPRWSPEADLRGRTLLVFGEQGLGDEVLFANVVPDLLAVLGPHGRLILAVEARLVDLFQRSFPAARVVPHATVELQARTVRHAPDVDVSTIDLWAPIGSLLRRFRRGVDAFPAQPSFLTPEPEAVKCWRGVLALAGPSPKVGLLWKSGKAAASRIRYYAPWAQWAPVLRTPGVAFVNLQYGDCAEEIAHARESWGVQIVEPRGIDLKADQDDLAALCAACDLVIGPANASTNIAGAVGAPLWLISTPGAWPRLGETDRYPWYPQARVFAPAAHNAWAPVMGEVAQALAAHF